MDNQKPNDGSSVATIKAAELMNRTFVTDDVGNVFSLPIGPEHNAALQAGAMPEGFELVFLAGAVNPKYKNVIAGAGILFQMVEAAKTLIEAHGEHLMNTNAPMLMQAGINFEAMAANLNLAQRQAIEGLRAMVAQTEKYRK